VRCGAPHGSMIAGKQLPKLLIAKLRSFSSLLLLPFRLPFYIDDEVAVATALLLRFRIIDQEASSLLPPSSFPILLLSFISYTHNTTPRSSYHISRHPHHTKASTLGIMANIVDPVWAFKKTSSLLIPHPTTSSVSSVAPIPTVLPSGVPRYVNHVERAGETGEKTLWVFISLLRNQQHQLTINRLSSP
jgi:hypothetical protein